MDEVIKAEFKRVDDENNRQNHRIDALEASVKQITDLVVNIKALTMSVESLTKEVQKQGKRLEDIERAPLAQLNGAKQTAINTLIGAVIGALAVGLIQMIAVHM